MSYDLEHLQKEIAPNQKGPYIPIPTAYGRIIIDIYNGCLEIVDEELKLFLYEYAGLSSDPHVMLDTFGQAVARESDRISKRFDTFDSAHVDARNLRMQWEKAVSTGIGLKRKYHQLRMLRLLQDCLPKKCSEVSDELLRSCAKYLDESEANKKLRSVFCYASHYFDSLAADLAYYKDDPLTVERARGFAKESQHMSQMSGLSATLCKRIHNVYRNVGSVLFPNEAYWS